MPPVLGNFEDHPHSGVTFIIIIITMIHFIYNAPVPVLQKRAPSTVQLHISDSIHS